MSDKTDQAVGRREGGHRGTQHPQRSGASSSTTATATTTEVAAAVGKSRAAVTAAQRSGTNTVYLTIRAKRRLRPLWEGRFLYAGTVLDPHCAEDRTLVSRQVMLEVDIYQLRHMDSATATCILASLYSACVAPRGRKREERCVKTIGLHGVTVRNTGPVNIESTSQHSATTCYPRIRRPPRRRRHPRHVAGERVATG